MRRIRYPKSRLPPIRHKVRAHVRRSKKGRLIRVRSYRRGSRLPEPSALRQISLPNLYPIIVTIQYPEGSERLTVRAPDYVSALDVGLMSRREIKPPKAVVLSVGGEW